jgi:hypothetical protein
MSEREREREREREEKKKNFVGVYRKGIVKRDERGDFINCCIDNDKDIEGHSLIIVNAKGVIIYKIKKNVLVQPTQMYVAST